jgi:ribose/xylose/arabinose/galactoside ABC-type transport system permease subunit
VLPLTSFLILVALGQMLVIMTGGIDLSVPSTMTLAALITVGVARGADERIALAIITALAVSALIGLTNGLLIGVLKLNALIITLAVGQIVRGILNNYATSVANEASVPPSLSEWATAQFLGMGYIFWLAILVTILMALMLRYSGIGRRFQSVGANPSAAWIAGLRVNIYIIFAYMVGAIFYGLGGVLLAAFIRSPTQGLGAPYLLGPIAAVVIGGASLHGGLASTISTWIAAFFLTILSQMLRVLGLPTSLQFVVFGLAIIGGMALSGDRIVDIVEGLFRTSFAPAEGTEQAESMLPAAE